MKISILGLTIITFFLCACSSTLERAQKFYEAGSYDEAIFFYEKALDESPQNDEARIGLRKSRLKWISSKLLEVRLLRLGGNIGQSRDLLNKVLSSEKSWNVFPTGAVAFTQEEESEFAARSIHVEIEKALKEGKPLLAANLKENHRGFFQGKRLSIGHDIDDQIRKLGKTGCQQMKRKLGREDYYFGLFTQKYCTYFGENIPDLSRQISRRHEFLYKDVQFIFKDGNLTSSHQKIIAEATLQALQNTAWFDPEGKKTLFFEGAGSFTAQHTTRPETLSHSYTVSVPYEAQWTEKKTTKNESGWSLAFDLISTLASAGSQNPSYRNETDNGDGTVTVRETRYREEPRTFDYKALVHRQKFSLDVSGAFQVNNQEIDLALKDSHSHQTIEHHNNMPDIDLYPKKPSLMPDADWIQAKAAELGAQFEEKARQAWKNSYCKEGRADENLKTSPEMIFRCLRAGTGHFPLNYSNWFKDNFGVSISETLELVGQI